MASFVYYLMILTYVPVIVCGLNVIWQCDFNTNSECSYQKWNAAKRSVPISDPRCTNCLEHRNYLSLSERNLSSGSAARNSSNLWIEKFENVTYDVCYILFWYYMQGELASEPVEDGKLVVWLKQELEDAFVVLWQIEGHQDYSWHYLKKEVSIQNETEIMFQGVVGRNWKPYIAIDDIQIACDYFYEDNWFVTGDDWDERYNRDRASNRGDSSLILIFALLLAVIIFGLMLTVPVCYRIHLTEQEEDEARSVMKGKVVQRHVPAKCGELSGASHKTYTSSLSSQSDTTAESPPSPPESGDNATSWVSFRNGSTTTSYNASIKTETIVPEFTSFKTKSDTIVQDFTSFKTKSGATVLDFASPKTKSNTETNGPFPDFASFKVKSSDLSTSGAKGESHK